MSTPTFATLFSGGGGSALGLKAAGFTPVLAVEYDADIASVYVSNLGEHMVVSAVQEVDYTPYREKVDLLQASPPCTRASVANTQAGESQLDLDLATATARAIEEIDPKVFIMENVVPYRHFKAFKIITDTLDRLGYWWQADNLDAADFGVPQNRRRLILRASKEFLPPRPTKVKWVGWLEAVEDILPTFPVTNLAPWQVKRLKESKYAEYISPLLLNGVGKNFKGEVDAREVERDAPPLTATYTLHPMRLLLSGNGQGESFISGCLKDSNTLTADGAGRLKALLLSGEGAGGFIGGDNPMPRSAEGDSPSYPLKATHASTRMVLVEGQVGGNREPRLLPPETPSFTRTGVSGGNILRIIDNAIVLEFTIEGLKRIQSFPDSYQFPDGRGRKKLASKILGNSVPPLMMQRIAEGFYEVLKCQS